MDTPKSKKMELVIPAYRMHSQSFLNVLDGISEEDALKRVENKTNHIVWMAGNFINMRYGLGAVLGLPVQDPYNDLFFQGKALDESFNYPSLADLKKNFHEISSRVYQKLFDITDEELDEIFEIGMNIPFIKETKLNFVGMCIGREDYLCGQIGLMRRILDYPGMKYDVDENLKY
ncbi:DinB family protein [Chryseobacterium arthrosphaerae]|uniref:DinB family protein n=1 Tax=Chryseobacterium arthrosphaerae TaxID=651561 RepID=UPI000F4D2B0B|nr:DinB family protein [Chryseobacterium arthrosphaerae]AYZ12609.1 DinB family protein [Chryseobacterium arthrosphaerae]MDG4651424.1 DinB family protein [Chryseobacterium arthrosphaerae]QUY57949.1 DinB family protein [Chryseobacterium arthrosphaerae]UEQ77883.1 DinB family protein [Chryseobacterium arthrosphaerae]